MPRAAAWLALAAALSGAPACASLAAPLQSRQAINFNVTRIGGAVQRLEARDGELKDALSNVAASQTASYYLAAARAYERSGVSDRAYDYLQMGLAADPSDPRLHDALARLWRDWGLPGVGLGESYRAIYLAPRSAAAHNTLGTLLHRIGNVAAAVEQFSQAEALDPDAWYATANLCHVHLAQGRTQLAIAECRRAADQRRRSTP